jgi:hypothetical protein
MRALSLALWAAVVVAQVAPRNQAAIARIGVSLMKLPERADDSVRQALMSDLIAAADKTHPPAQAALAEFIRRLADALSGKQLSARDAAQLANAIYDVLHSAGARAFPLEDHLWRVKRVLVAANVSPLKVRSIMENLEALGIRLREGQDAAVQ